MQEMQVHFDMEVEAVQRRGLNAEKAKRCARLKVGSVSEGLAVEAGRVRNSMAWGALSGRPFADHSLRQIEDVCGSGCLRRCWWYRFSRVSCRHGPPCAATVDRSAPGLI